MALDPDRTGSLKNVILSLFLASLAGAAILMGATILEGLQFADTGGRPDAYSLVMFVLTLLFFATPIMALVVIPIGVGAWTGLSRAGLWRIWIVIPGTVLIGYGASVLMPFIPDVVLVSQLPSPTREIATMLSAVLTGLLLWRGARPATYVPVFPADEIED